MLTPCRADLQGCAEYPCRSDCGIGVCWVAWVAAIGPSCKDPGRSLCEASHPPPMLTPCRADLISLRLTVADLSNFIVCRRSGYLRGASDLGVAQGPWQISQAMQDPCSMRAVSRTGLPGSPNGLGSSCCRVGLGSKPPPCRKFSDLSTSEGGWQIYSKTI